MDPNISSNFISIGEASSSRADKSTEVKKSSWRGFGRQISYRKDKAPIETAKNILAQSTPLQDTTYYLDKNRLLRSDNPAQPIKSTHREWFLNEATILECLSKADQATQKQLELILLQGYSKAATVSTEISDQLDIQTSPFLHEDERYHRSTPRNILLDSVCRAFAKDMGIIEHEAILIDSPLIAEVFAREFHHPGLNLTITDKQDFENLVDTLFEQIRLEQFPQNRVLIDVSRYIANLGIAPTELKQKMILELEDIFMQKLKEFVKDNPSIEPENIASKLMCKTHLIAYSEHRGQSILLMPEFLLEPRFDPEGNALILKNSVRSRHGAAYRDIYSVLSKSGFQISPDQAKSEWVKLEGARSILQELEIPIASLATKGGNIASVCKSFEDFMNRPVVNKFRDLSRRTDAAPYLKVLPEATWALLNGLQDYNQNGGIQGEFKNKGIEDLLQISYFRMMHAMGEAILRRDNQMEFQNQIELINQEVQNILAVIQPYDDKALAQAISDKLDPIIPENLKDIKIYLKASAMHSLSSVLGSVEAEKGSNQLKVAILKDSYYESSGVLEGAKTYQLHVLDGDKFNQGGLDHAFEETPKEPIDLFVCEFHHNISSVKQSYSSENVLDQVKEMIEKGLVADKFTISIDTTIDIEKSREIENFLADKMIQGLINDGRLNVVFLRSAQKFDMFGMDNYYGGITTTINNNESFNLFNQRMDRPEDQLKGLSYQGLAHLQKHGGANLDNYRLAIMENTQKIYQGIPEKAIYREGLTNPMQVSKIDDDRIVFLDIKFPNYPSSATAFKKAITKFATLEKLPFTKRPSFGFANTNFTVIEGKKFRLNPGLESEETVEKYRQFFIAVQALIDDTLNDPQNANLNLKELDQILAVKLNGMYSE